MPPAVYAAIEAAARDSRAQLLSFVAARAGGDLAGAEDALGEAFLAALRQWPEEGVPAKPEAWLLTLARRRLTDMQRRSQTRDRHQDALRHALESAQALAEVDDDFPDERLKLLFVCAHPAIDPATRTPLMLQTVLGLEAERIAAAFLTAPAAMSQRLVRAKTRIRAAGIPFAIPRVADWPERLAAVLDAVYVAYTAGSEEPEAKQPSLAAEALRLARLLIRLAPGEPEPLGLLALLLHVEARAAARTSHGRYVPLPEQDVRSWNQAQMAEAEAALRQAAACQAPGRFQLEAAIQSVHASRAVTGRTDWAAIAGIYTLLLRHTPALGARVGHAIATARLEGASAGLALLEAMDQPGTGTQTYQPWWAARASLLAEAGRVQEAAKAYAQAIAMCPDGAARRFLEAEKARLS